MSQGATSTDNNFQMNGLTINDTQGSWIYSQGIPAPNPDTIQEFRVQTALFDATTGRNAGANVNVITKSGTNEYHASMFEFFRNEDLNANDWFTKSFGEPRGILRQNQYGFTAGGPLVKDKVLLFGSWQGTKQYNETDPANHKVVYEPPLTNDRSAAGLGAVFGGQEGYLGLYLAAPSPPDGSNIAPQALALLQTKLPNGQYMIPTPQTINPSAAGGFDSEGRSVYDAVPASSMKTNGWRMATIVLSDRNKIAVRYFGAASNQEWSTLYETEGYPLYQPERFDVASIGETFILSPSLVNNFLVGLPSVDLEPDLRKCVYLLEPGHERPGPGERRTPTSGSSPMASRPAQLRRLTFWSQKTKSPTPCPGPRESTSSPLVAASPTAETTWGNSTLRPMSSHLPGRIFCSGRVTSSDPDTLQQYLRDVCGLWRLPARLAIQRCQRLCSRQLQSSEAPHPQPWLAPRAHRRPRVRQWRRQRRCVQDRSESACDWQPQRLPG